MLLKSIIQSLKICTSLILQPHPHIHVVLLARIFLVHKRYSSLSSVAPGRSSRLHPVSAQSDCRQVLGGRPTFACLCKEVHRSTSLMSSALLLQQCPTCQVRLIWMFSWWVVGGHSAAILSVVPPGLVQ